MAYTEQIIIDKIEILEDSQMQIRQATKVFRDGVGIAKTYLRHCIAPDISETDLLKEDKRVQDICKLIYTKEVKDSYEAEKLKKKIP